LDGINKESSLMLSLNIDKIKEAIPQRYPMLFIDKIIELDPGKRVIAIKQVTINEQFFQGHFPDKPIMPGTLIIEAMAQTSTFLFYDPDKNSQKLNFYLGVVKDIRFLKAVLPGDKLKIAAEPLRLADESAHVKVKATVSDETVSQGELIFVRRKS